MQSEIDDDQPLEVPDDSGWSDEQIREWEAAEEEQNYRESLAETRSEFRWSTGKPNLEGH